MIKLYIWKVNLKKQLNTDILFYRIVGKAISVKIVVCEEGRRGG